MGQLIIGTSGLAQAELLPEPAAPAPVQESAPEGIVAMPHALPAA